MRRRNISLPDELDRKARDAGLNVSALTRRAIEDELDRQERMARLDAWLDELDAAHGRPSATEVAAAERWADGAVLVAARPGITTTGPGTARGKRAPVTKAPKRQRRAAG